MLLLLGNPDYFTLIKNSLRTFQVGRVGQDVFLLAAYKFSKNNIL